VLTFYLLYGAKDDENAAGGEGLSNGGEGTRERYYHSTDHEGSTDVITDSSGNIVWDGDYEAFGSVVRSNGTIRFDASYTGKEFDTDTGLYYFNARWYDPTLGRFITEDPARDGNNWFAYVGNNPMSRVDPNGLLDIQAMMDSSNPSMDIIDDVGTAGVKGAVRDVSEGFNNPLTTENSSGVNVGRALSIGTMAAGMGETIEVATAGKSALELFKAGSYSAAASSLVTMGFEASKKGLLNAVQSTDSWIKTGLSGVFGFLSGNMGTSLGPRVAAAATASFENSLANNLVSGQRLDLTGALANATVSGAVKATVGVGIPWVQQNVPLVGPFVSNPGVQAAITKVATKSAQMLFPLSSSNTGGQ
jgi:RHS repeat-associated protein